MDTKLGWSVGAAGPVQQPDCVGVESRGRGAGLVLPSALAHSLTTPIPHAPGVHMWSVGAAGGQYNSQSKRAKEDCAEFVFPYTLFYSVIYNSEGYTKLEKPVLTRSLKLSHLGHS